MRHVSELSPALPDNDWWLNFFTSEAARESEPGPCVLDSDARCGIGP